MENVMDNALSQESTESQKSAERLFRQAEINEIVGRAKHEAVESYKRNNAQQHQSSGLTESDIRRLASEQLAREREQWMEESRERADAENAERIVNAYKSKIAAGKDKYDDFEKVTNVDMRAYPNVVQLLAENVDNAADVLYELSKNRLKMAQLQSLSEKSHADAIYEARRLADSIKENEKTVVSKQAKEPLSQLKPSNSGLDSGNALSWTDLKRKYR